MPVRGLKQALKNMRDRATRAAHPEEALEAVGRTWRQRHQWYFRRHVGSQLAQGGGPPGDPWRGLKEATVQRKEKRGRTQKLIDRGTLRMRFMFRVIGRRRVVIYNEDHLKTGYLQDHHGFAVVVTDPARQDPQQHKKTIRILKDFLVRGKKENGAGN